MAGGLFDDLVPAGATTAPPRGLFDDLIPHQGQGGGKGALGREQDTTLAQKEAAARFGEEAVALHLGGEMAHRLMDGDQSIVDHLVKMVEDKAEEIKAKEAAATAAE